MGKIDIPEINIECHVGLLEKFIAIVPSTHVFEAIRQGYVDIEAIWDIDLTLHHVMLRPDAAKIHCESLGVTWPD